ncbi:putative LRR receptor-like serine/threonine-protein kinase [Hibiscus syriacus]|uniref:LRR receptor-like serine/threonine-protein kinase n=1 Tax=Hibiscus syriacus TaxID=106335 RepID=A0A6A3BDL9_HIBSY|nr:putative LRR receptor-like serine/threonine-protein kinase [Hibiscus syriacus]
MGHGQEHNIRDDAQVEIQEKGEIFFFYRPKVNKEEVHSVDDVQRLYIVLRPETGERAVEEKQDPHSGKEGAKSESDEEEEPQTGSTTNQNEGGQGCQKVNIEEEPLFRFIVMGRKTLPDPSKKSQSFWGFVELVTTKIEDVKDALKGEEYDTSSRGHRHIPPARAPKEEEEENEPQESLNIEREGSFLIQIKNPSKASNSEFKGLGNKRKAVFPAHLQGQLGKNKYHPADPPDFLNYEG